MDYTARLPPQSTFGIPPSTAHAFSSHHNPHQSHPMSSDRLRPVQQPQNKKAKLGAHDHGGGGRGHGHNTEESTVIGGGSDYTFPPLSSSSSFRHPQHPSSSSSSLHQASYGGPQYAQSSFFSSGTSTSPSSSSSFMHPQAADMSSRGRSFTSATTSATYPPHPRSRPPTAPGSGSETRDMLAAYSEPSSTRTASGGTAGPGVTGTAQSSFSLDWPAPSSSGNTSGVNSASPSTATSAGSAQGGSAEWLDYLSGNSALPQPTQGHTQSHPATPTTSIPSSSSASHHTPKLSSVSAQSMGWASQSRSRPGTSSSSSGQGGSDVRRSASGGDGSGGGFVGQLFGAGTARGGEVKKEG